LHEGVCECRRVPCPRRDTNEEQPDYKKPRRDREESRRDCNESVSANLLVTHLVKEHDAKAKTRGADNIDSGEIMTRSCNAILLLIRY
jgi:hypothetical protein